MRLMHAVCFVAFATAAWATGLEQDAPCGRINPLSHYSSARVVERFNESTKLVASMLLPVRLPTFHSLHLEQAPMYLRRENPQFFANLFDIAHIDLVLSSNTSAYAFEAGYMQHGLDWKVVRQVVDETGEEWSMTTAKDNITLSEAHDLFDRGWSVVINRMEHRWPSIQRMAQAIEDIFGPRVQVNLYLTPPKSQAFEAHFDWMDGFIMQINGEKNWKIYDSLTLQPRPDMRFKPSTSDMTTLGEPLDEIRLTPGDVLYIPAGFVHQAETKHEDLLNEPSLHLTFGVEVGTHYSWEVLLHHIIDAGLGLAVCSESEDSQHEQWGLRCVNGQPVVDIHLNCASDDEQQASCKQICSLPLRHLLHQSLGFLASQQDSWELRRMVPITDAMRIVSCSTSSYHHCILETLTERVDQLIVSLQSLNIEDALAYGNYSGLLEHWRESGDVENVQGCRVGVPIPTDVGKRTDIFPRYLADYVSTMQDVSQYAAKAQCFSSLTRTGDVTQCATTRQNVESFMACLVESIIFADEGEPDDNATFLYRTITPATVAGWQLFIKNILDEKSQREAQVYRSLTSNIAKLQQSVSSAKEPVRRTAGVDEL